MPAAPPQAQETTTHFDTIDLLRGISIVAVILLHIAFGFAPRWNGTDSVLPGPLLHLLFRNGMNGVFIFFAVSGFLITYTSMRRFGTLGRVRPAVFYRLRFARIAPLLLLLLAVLSALDLARIDGFTLDPHTASLAGVLWSALTFRLNWYTAQHGYLPTSWNVLWSLSVEETFYLFFPLLAVLLLRRRYGIWFWNALLGAFVVMGPLARSIWASDIIWRESSYLGNMDAIALGCLTAILTARLQSRPPSRTVLTVLQAAGSLMIVVVFLWPGLWLHPTVRFVAAYGLVNTILALGTCLILLASVLRVQKGRSSTWSAPMRWFGRHSYEIYLTHEFAVVLVSRYYLRTLQANVLLCVFIILVLAAALGWLTARFFSEPLNRLLRPTFNS